MGQGGDCKALPVRFFPGQGDPDLADFPEKTVTHQFDPPLKIDRGPLLTAHLNDGACPSGDLHHRPGLGNAGCGGLLDIDVFARVHRRDHDQGMPMVGCGDEHRVDVRPGQNLPEIGINVASLVLTGGLRRAVGFLDLVPGFQGMRLVDIADRDDLGVRRRQHLGHITLPLSPASDQGEGDPVIR